MKIIIINGPNLNMLGQRDHKTYGTFTLNEINKLIVTSFPDVEFEFFQSNHEGYIVDYIQNLVGEKIDGVIINPAAYSHYSVAIYDALELIKQLKVEVHLSNPDFREDFRHSFITAQACNYVIKGLYEHSYIKAVEYILKNTPN